MTFFPLSLKVLATTFVIAALAGGAVALTRPKPIDSAVLGSEWQCHKTAFVITTCALRTQRRQCLRWRPREPIDTSLARFDSGQTRHHLSSNLGPSHAEL